MKKEDPLHLPSTIFKVIEGNFEHSAKRIVAYISLFFIFQHEILNRVYTQVEKHNCMYDTIRNSELELCILKSIHPKL